MKGKKEMTHPFLLTALHREELAVDLQEEEVMEEVVEEEAVGPQVEEAVEEKLEDPMEDLPLLKVEEEGVEEEQEEPVVKLQVEEVAVVEEEGVNPASPALHLPSPSLATLVKAQVKMEFKNTSCHSRFSLNSRKGYSNFLPGNIFAGFFPNLVLRPLWRLLLDSDKSTWTAWRMAWRVVSEDGWKEEMEGEKGKEWQIQSMQGTREVRG